MRKDPIILLKPADSQAVGANQQLMSDALAAIPVLATPGSIEGFDLIHTDKKRDLLRLTQELQWQHTFASPSIWETHARQELADGEGTLDLAGILGVTAASTLFCFQSEVSYVVEECRRCGAYCQGFVEKDGCPCCYGEDDPGYNTCDCTEGDGFEPAMRCPLHNMRHDYEPGPSEGHDAKGSDQYAWAPTVPPDPYRGLSASQASHLKGLMNCVAGGEIAKRFAVRYPERGSGTDRGGQG